MPCQAYPLWLNFAKPQQRRCHPHTVPEHPYNAGLAVNCSLQRSDKYGAWAAIHWQPNVTRPDADIAFLHHACSWDCCCFRWGVAESRHMPFLPLRLGAFKRANSIYVMHACKKGVSPPPASKLRLSENMDNVAARPQYHALHPGTTSPGPALPA